MVEDPSPKLGLTPALPEGEIGRHLLTSYSSSNPRDLFCENFMAYIAHGPEFREKAKNSPFLLKMYEELKQRIFKTPDGIAEYMDSPHVSIAEKEQNVSRWRNEMRKRNEEGRLDKDHEEAKQAIIGEFIESPEETREKAWKQDEEREAREIEEQMGGFVGAYYAMTLLDQTGQRVRSFGFRPDPLSESPEGERTVVKAMAEALK